MKIKKYWWVLALIFIFLFSYHIRSINTAPDRLLSFDPIYQYRFTKYFADWGHLPAWDELSYYVGREVRIHPPFMWYLTAFFYWIQPFRWSLLTTCVYASVFYGAIIAIAAFLLGKELSNEIGGLFSSILVGTAPQILIRTFGSSFDTDQLVLFFLIFTLYLWVRSIKKKTLSSFFLMVTGFAAFMLAWNMSIYSFLIIVVSLAVNFFLIIILKSFKGDVKLNFIERIKSSLKNIKLKLILLICLFLSLVGIGFVSGRSFINPYIFSFILEPETRIVNISIAELQPFNIFNIKGWMMAMGRFGIGNNFIDILILTFFLLMIFFGLFFKYKKMNIEDLSFLLTIFLIGVYTTFRGIRFTEFTSGLFLILVGVGFGSLIKFLKSKLSLKIIILSLGIIISIFAINMGVQVGGGLGPDVNSNWDNAWKFLRTETPESSLIGTWWDPGHMIAGLGERRNMADGAHCGESSCLLSINDRITDAGKIMATKDENESVSLIRKYQGDSEKAYWIASDDLIGKFQWCQYFGTGCDARTDPSCPLYMQIRERSRSFDNMGNVLIRNYNMGSNTKIIIYHAQIPIPIFIQGINAALFDEIIIYNNTQALPIKFSEEERNSLLTVLKPLERQLSVRFTNQTIDMAVWIPRHFSYIVVIPPHQRNTVFTRMFFLEGQGLNHFKQVFRNEQVKIYEVV